MRVDKMMILAKREYLSRVKTKGFWIGTILFPVFMLAVTILPAFIASRTKSTLRLAVVDATGTVGKSIAAGLRQTEAQEPKAADVPETEPTEPKAAAVDESASADQKRKSTASATRFGRPRDQTTFQVELLSLASDANAQRSSLDRRVLDKDIDAWLWVDEAGLAENKIEYHGESVANFITQERLARAVSRAVTEARLAAAGFDVATIEKLSRPVEFATVRVTEEGGRKEGGLAGALVAYLLVFMLYLMLALYGSQVLNGVIEEKSSRIVELIVSTVTPFELLMGKLIGIGAVGFTQVAIWLTTVGVLTAPAVVLAVAWMPELPPVSPLLIVNFLLFFVLGFFLYATYYAALGSAFNDIKEAQQAASSAMFLLVPPMLIFPLVLNDPDSTLSVVTSLIPFFSPLLMVLRVAIKQPPLWQLLTSYVLTTATTLAMIWFCAKIYRVGILMYGKKPTLQELWRWTRYS